MIDLKRCTYSHDRETTFYELKVDDKVVGTAWKTENGFAAKTAWETTLEARTMKELKIMVIETVDQMPATEEIPSMLEVKLPELPPVKGWPKNEDGMRVLEIHSDDHVFHRAVTAFHEQIYDRRRCVH